MPPLSRSLNDFPKMFGRKSLRALRSKPLNNVSVGSALIVAKGFVFLHVFYSYIGGVGSTSGISMVPTMPHDYLSRPWILYSSLHRRGRNLRVGDVITYTNPIFPKESGCKRIIGMPGDFVSVVTPGRHDTDVQAVDIEGEMGERKRRSYKGT
jgi:signal peptidase I